MFRTSCIDGTDLLQSSPGRERTALKEWCKRKKKSICTIFHKCSPRIKACLVSHTSGGKKKKVCLAQHFHYLSFIIQKKPEALSVFLFWHPRSRHWSLLWVCLTVFSEWWCSVHVSGPRAVLEGTYGGAASSSSEGQRLFVFLREQWEQRGEREWRGTGRGESHWPVRPEGWLFKKKINKNF